MSLAAPARNERLEARMTAEQKALIHRAAGLLGTSISDFVLGNALQAAKRVVENETHIRLSAEASRKVAQALLHPAPPTAELRDAWAEFQRVVQVRG